ncbi:unnamed protein product [Schistocephalus solidus]|uniref:Tripartite motif-containing protein 5 n=1 Tax=Schistocephalus solidus TaxID=70667 RepID=A0A183T4R6_SCHSO|nr:unnamed protein product [Schistocephalus solidus]
MAVPPSELQGRATHDAGAAVYPTSSWTLSQSVCSYDKALANNIIRSDCHKSALPVWRRVARYTADSDLFALFIDLMADDGIDPDLICGICKQILRDPYLLPCDHSFCKSPCLLSSPVQSQGTVCCPICFIELDVSNISPNRELSSRLRSLDVRVSAKKSFTSPSHAQCPACRNVCRTLTNCEHCSSSICESCADKHLVMIRNSLISRMSSLMTQRDNLMTYRSDLVTVKNITEENYLRKAELSAGIEEATECLIRACEQAFERSLGDLTVEDLQVSERLQHSLEELTNVSEVFALVAGQLFDMQKEEDMSNLMIFQKQASSAVSQIEGLVRRISKLKHPEPFECWKVSKTFETIGDTLVSTNLVVCDVFHPSTILAHNFHGFQSHPKGALSSSDEYVASVKYVPCLTS